MTWLVKMQGFEDAKYLGVVTEKGRDYYIIQWDKFTPTPFYGSANYYIRKVAKEQCTLYRKPGKKEQAIINWFNKIFGK